MPLNSLCMIVWGGLSRPQPAFQPACRGQLSGSREPPGKAAAGQKACPTGNKIARGIGPLPELELEPCLQQPTRYDAPAFQYQLRLGPQEEGADLEQPCRRRKTGAHTPRLTQRAH